MEKEKMHRRRGLALTLWGWPLKPWYQTLPHTQMMNLYTDL